MKTKIFGVIVFKVKKVNFKCNKQMNKNYGFNEVFYL